MIFFSIFKQLFALILLVGIGSVQLHNLNQLKADKRLQTSNTSIYQDERMALRLELLSNLPDIGFKNIISNWVFLNFLQYFGNSEARDIDGYGLSPNFFDIIVSRDPYFIDSYIYLSNSVSLYAGNPIESIRLMEKGLMEMSSETIPRAYYVWRYKAIDELLFVGDTQAAQKSYETAADWAEQSSDPEAAFVAQLSRKTARFLMTDPNSKPAQINAWSQILVRAIDENIRQEAIAQIEALGGTILVSENGQVTVRYKP